MAVWFVALGDAYINVHGDTDPFARDIHTDVPRIAHEADSLMESIGEGWGKKLSDGSKSELRRRLPSIVQEFERGAKAVRIRIGGDQFLLDRRGGLRGLGGQFTSMFVEEAERAFSKVTAPGGPFSKIGEAISDAIGAGANVSGKSPLIAFLVPAFGAIGAVILGAVQAVNAFVAVLTTLPALLTAISLQVGVLMLAFDGMGSAIQNAFKATNAQELQEAIKGLTPAAQGFVRQLLPIRDFFNYLKTVAQQNFFSAFGDTLTRILAAIHPVLSGGFAQLATAMGTLFRQLGLFFASPTFVDFVRDVFPATAKWLQSFGPSFVSLLKALIGMADAAIPFLTRIGAILQNSLASFTDWLNGMVKSGSFTKWLNSMGSTLDTLANVFFQLSEFVATFFAQLDEAGGEELLKTLGDAFEHLAFVLASPAGLEAMKGLVTLAIQLTTVFIGLIDAIVGIVAAYQFALESIHEFWRFMSEVYVPGWWDLWTNVVPNALTVAWNAVAEFFSDLWFRIRMGFDQFIQAGKEWAENTYVWVTSLPGRLLSALGDLGSLLWSKGRSLIQGFIDGIISKWNELRAIAANIAHTIAGFLPGSPAKEGPLSGQGYALYRGQRMVQDLARGITSEAPVVSQASAEVAGSVFNTNLNFYGQQPSETQAKAAGRAVTGEIDRQMAARDIRLAVRMA